MSEDKPKIRSATTLTRTGSSSEVSNLEEKKKSYFQRSARRDRTTSCVLGMLLLVAVGSCLVFLFAPLWFQDGARQLPLISTEDLQEHSTTEDCWQLIHGKVYDLSDYKHPAGEQLLTPFCGTDATETYDAFHVSGLLVIIASFQVGFADPMKQFSYATLQQHNGELNKECWTVVDGDVYNMTGVQLPAPEGASSAPMSKYCGTDGGHVFNMYPPDVFDSLMNPIRIGYLANFEDVPADGIRISELALHNDSELDCWVSIHETVYDMTAYAQVHPGGAASITAYCGSDGTQAYDLFHEGDEMDYLRVIASSFVVGPYVTQDLTASIATEPSGTLDEISYQEVQLHNVELIDCWTVVDGQVYNLTNVVLPNVLDISDPFCGKDASSTFANYPATLLQSLIGKNLMGTLYSGRTINTTELTLHSDEATDCWVILHKKAYDMTEYSKLHPGAPGTITSFCGSDGTSAYELYHEYGLLTALAVDYEVGLYLETPVEEPPPSPEVIISHAELLRHNESAADCWVVMHGNVYNMTLFAASHPGGAPAITAFCGADGTAGFDVFHGRGLLFGKAAQFKVGVYDVDSIMEVTETPAPVVSHFDLILHGDEESDCWVVMHGVVYNMTQYAQVHPGGVRTIAPFCGADGTAAFNAYHGVGLLNRYTMYAVGTFDAESIPVPTLAPALTVSHSELILNNDADEGCWVVIHETVYNMTEYAPLHPGHARTITTFCGADGTGAFDAYHGIGLLKQYNEYTVGTYDVASIPAPTAAPVKWIVHAEMVIHNDATTDCWVVIHGTVYDMTEYSALHPGGDQTITPFCGGDGSEAFDAYHGIGLLKRYSEYAVGTLDVESIPEPTTAPVVLIPLSELTLHDDVESDCWVTIHGTVYDMTEFAQVHPGGPRAITAFCGRDGTSGFAAFHGRSHLFSKAAAYTVGTYEGPNVVDSSPSSETVLNLPEAVSTMAISLAMLSSHDGVANCWIALHGIVYDMTEYPSQHPGGSHPITAFCGRDGTEGFAAFHGVNQLNRLAQLFPVGSFEPIAEELEEPTLAVISHSELILHDDEVDCWVVMHGKVYNMTTYAPIHPGGPRSISAFCGEDGTVAFGVFHSVGLLSSKGVAFALGVYDSSTVTEPEPVVLRVVPHSELELHDDSETACWIVMHGMVYDMTDYAESHPGGAPCITAFCGADSTIGFDFFHGTGLLRNKALPYLVGEYDNTTIAETEVTAPLPLISHSELVLHGDEDGDCWIILHGNVYNMTSYATVHPGGAPPIAAFCGDDGSEGFDAFHGLGLLRRIEDDYLVGPFDNTTIPVVVFPTVSHAELLLHDGVDASDCWVVMHGSVYDMTTYAPLHPGDARTITPFCGTDGTEAFNAFHGVGRLYGKGAVYKIGNYNVTSIADVTAAPTPIISPTELSLHDDDASDCWLVMHQMVYDMTDYAATLHPGGAGSITTFCGVDGTEAFRHFHGAGLLRSKAADYVVGWYEPNWTTTPPAMAP